jgi:Ser/Thr protein kinase RdoA (MazF antagonist)
LGVLGNMEPDEVATIHSAVATAYHAAFVGNVHGDLHDFNIFARHDGLSGDWHIQFIDFDTAGVEGSVTYPWWLNKRLKWHKDAVAGAIIRKEHDLHLIDVLPGSHEI